MKYNQTWDLEAIFPGGTESPALQVKLEAISEQVKVYADMLEGWEEVERETTQNLQALLDIQEEIGKGLGQVMTFVSMTHDAFMDDKHANVMKGKAMTIASEIRKLSNVFVKKLVTMSDVKWAEVLQTSPFDEYAFVLEETRRDGKRLLSDAEENLLADLNQDGLAAWSDLYSTSVSTMSVPFTDKNGETKNLSVGQAQNRVYADPDNEVRAALFENWEGAWGQMAPIFTDVLNHLSGYRLTVQKAHGYTHHLEEPLEYNRMKKETLDAMWGAIDQNKAIFVKFLEKKAELLGKEKLAWQDVEAPIALGDFEAKKFTYDEAADFVIENFATFGDRFSAFAKYALENRWVEAEDRPNKRPGGYCTHLPEFEESRIFMTFTGSPSDVDTLAHELGHAFHSHVLQDIPRINRGYAMNVAETASTFAEQIVSEATIKAATSREEKVSLLGAKIERATAMFMNIHARFLFEDAFYTERKAGVVSESRLNELMVDAQKKAFDDSLSDYHPHFWCSKLHFYIDAVPFYNFPYTFGYLFSMGIYAAYLKNPDHFEEKYIALLKDTGKMRVEDLAQKHLDIDITKQAFWTAGIELVAKDVEAFMALVD